MNKLLSEVSQIVFQTLKKDIDNVKISIVNDFPTLENVGTKPHSSTFIPLYRTKNPIGLLTSANSNTDTKIYLNQNISDFTLVELRNENNRELAVVKSIEYDPSRTARVAKLYYKDGSKSYIIAPLGLTVGQTIMSGENVAPEVGNALPLSKIPVGTVVHNIELKPGKGAAIGRSAGTFVQLVAREGEYATLKMPSGEMRNVLSRCIATVGTVSNADHMNESVGKAGRTRWRGRRPRNRGVAMNPVDHPMGGGEGRASGGHPGARIVEAGRAREGNFVHAGPRPPPGLHWRALCRGPGGHA